MTSVVEIKTEELMIIIAVIGALGILLAIVLNFANMSTFNEEYFYRVKNTEKAYYIAVSTMPAIMQVFAMDDASYDGPSDTWAQALPAVKTKEGKIYFQIEDEDRYFNPNYIINSDKKEENEEASNAGSDTDTDTAQGKIEKWHYAQFKRLLKITHCEESLADKAADWIDSGNTPTLPGGFEGKAPSGVNYKNAELDSIYEILYILDTDKGDFYGKTVKDTGYPGLGKPGLGKPGLEKLLTVYSGGKVNINTAPKEILMSLDDAVTEETANAIIRRRAENPFKNVKELGDIPGINMDILYKLGQVADVKSEYYRIRITVDMGQIKPTLNCVVKRNENGFTPVVLKME